MGYTHYWIYNDPQPEGIQKALTNIRAIILDQMAILAGPDGEGKPEMDENGICFNGIGDDGCEAFYVDREPENGFNFCKTYERPYDVVVTACLIVLQHFLKKGVEVSSDGEKHEWQAGLELAQRVTGHTFKVPTTV